MGMACFYHMKVNVIIMTYFRFFIILIILINTTASSQSIEVKVHSFSGYPGETHFTKITIDDLTGLVFIAGIIAIDIELTYDPNILLARNAAEGNVIPPGWSFITNMQNPGKIIIQMMSGLQNGQFVELNEIGEIVKVSFQISNNARAGQTSSLILSKVYVNENADIVTKINGVCNVLGYQQNTIFTLRLKPGWNLISIPINIENTNIDAFLNAIIGKYESIWSWDRQNEWKKNIYNAPSWLNDLKSIEPGKGYWIKMFSQANIDISGQELDYYGIQLYKGWNLVGFNSMAQMSVNTALSSITGYYNSIWGYDPQQADWKKLIIGAPNQVNNLSVLKPGEGYWIEAKNNIVWNVNSYTASPMQFNVNNDIDNDMPVVPCLIYGKINLENFGEAMSYNEVCLELSCNNSIKQKCKIENKNYDFYYFSYCPKSFFGNLLKINLFINKNLIYSDKVLCGYSGDLIRLDINYESTTKRNFLYQNYPNPFNPETWIPYEVKEASEVKIIIYDINYRIIRKLELGYKLPGFYDTKEKSAYWDGKNDCDEPVTSGLYFYSIKMDNFSGTRKMILLR